MVISGGTLYVANYGDSEIVSYTASNPTGTVFATSSSGLDNPIALAVYGGNLYVANYTSSTIESFSLATGSSSAATFASGGDVSSPISLAVDGSGNLYLGDYGGSDIYKYSIVSGSASGTVFSGTDVHYPYGMVVSGSNLYATYYSESGLIYSYPLAGGSPTVFASSSGTSELAYPFGLALDGSGNLYAANGYSNTVEKYSLATGSSSATQFASTGVDGPEGVAAGTLLPVPEPSAWFATLAGLGVVFYVRWHRRARG